MTDAIQNALVADLYKAAVDQSEWPDLLDRLCTPLGARGSALVTVDLSGQYDYQVTFGSSLYPPAIMRTYESEYSRYEEEHFRRVATSAAHSIQYDHDFELYRSGELARPDIDYLDRSFGVSERFAVRLSHDQSWFDCLTFQYASARGNVTAEETARLKAYLAHMAEVMVLSRCFSHLKIRFGAVLAMLDKILNGLLLVSHSGHVILSNTTAQAILHETDGLFITRDGRLSTSDKQVQLALTAAIAEASATVEACGGASHVLMPIKRQSGKDNYLVDVSPIRDTNGEIGGGFFGALVTIVDPDHESEIDLAGMCAVYKLSPAELEVARGIIDGRTNGELADIRGVSVDTIKSQVRSVFRKTQVANRSELVRRALRVALPLDF